MPNRDSDVNARYVPNSPEPAKVGKKTLDDQLVSVGWIVGKVGITVPIPNALKAIRAGASWKKPGWSKGKVLR